MGMVTMDQEPSNGPRYNDINIELKDTSIADLR